MGHLRKNTMKGQRGVVSEASFNYHKQKLIPNPNLMKSVLHL